jgi:hypothetical protein
MRTHVLRAHVTRNGGKLASAGEEVSFLCCDKATPVDEMKKLWGESPGPVIALNNAFISKSVVAQERLEYQDFLMHGVLQPRSPSKKSAAVVRPPIPPCPSGTVHCTGASVRHLLCRIKLLSKTDACVCPGARRLASRQATSH